MTLAEDIINGADITSVIGRYVSLTKAGSNYKGLCPFHGEKSPSFVVSPHKQIFKCFGCGVGGDVITFIKEIEHVDFIEAAKILAKDAGVTIQDYQSKNYNPQKQNDKERMYDMNHTAKNYYLTSLKQSSDALDYVREQRWLSDDIIRKFSIGYASDSYYQMVEYLKNKGYTIDQQIQASLAKSSQRGDAYAFFRDRVVFPIFDTRNRVVWFGGRAIQPDTQPKYVNTTDTMIYDKSSVLYGINRAKSAVREQWSIIVVEGYMDVIGLHRLWYESAVATCGTALTTYHIKTLKKYTDRIMLLFDQDKAGFEATKRALSLAYAQDLYPLVISLPDDYKDVDDLAQAVDTHQATIPDITQSTQDGMQYVVQQLQKQIDTTSPIDKKRLLNEVFQLIAMVASLSIQQHYLTLIADILNMNDTIIITEFQQFVSTNKRSLQQHARRADTQETKESTWWFHPSEEELLAGLLLDQWIVEQLPTIEKVASLLERWEAVAPVVGGVLSDVIASSWDGSYTSDLITVQLWREDELIRFEKEPEQAYGYIMRRVWSTIQRMTQSALKRLDNDEKKKLIELLHVLR